MTAHSSSNSSRPRVAVSACLIGQTVRYDGDHCRHASIADEVGTSCELLPVCPEVELGLGTPREPIQIESHDTGLQLRSIRSRLDHTTSMREFAIRRVEELNDSSIDGYITKSKSPSCGLRDVKVWSSLDDFTREGRGFFVDELCRQCPNLPVVQETELEDEAERFHFLTRVFAHRRLSQLLGSNWSAGDVVEFHTSEKMLLLAHHESSYRQLGPLVAGVGQCERAAFAEEYSTLFMSALSHRPTPTQHLNAIQHMAGHLSDCVTANQRDALRSVFTSFEQGDRKLEEVLRMLSDYAEQYGREYILRQTYVQPPLLAMQ